MGKPTGFKEFTRELPSKLPSSERKKNYKEFVEILFLNSMMQCIEKNGRMLMKF
jgi:hypothetical protein